MSEKILVEMTQEQIDYLREIVKLGIDVHRNGNLVLKQIPSEFNVKTDFSVPKEKPDVDFLITSGSIADIPSSRFKSFTSMFKKFAKVYPDVATEYLVKLFESPKTRGFSFSSDFRKRVSEVGLELGIMPESGLKYYARSYANSGSNHAWIVNNLTSGKLPDSIWDILAGSKEYSVLAYVIQSGPDNILPHLLPSISKVKKNNGVYNYSTRKDYTSEYLEYLFEHRAALIRGKIKLWKPIHPYVWMKTNRH